MWLITQIPGTPGHSVRIAALLFLAGLVLIAARTEASEPPLTLAEAQRRAAQQSRSLVAQDAAVSASREMAVAAGQLPDPVLRMGIDNLPIDGPDQFSVAR